MSKKHKKIQQQAVVQGVQPAALSQNAEYRVIKFDLIKVLILNLVYLAVILTLYYGNQRSHFLDNWFAKVLHF